MQRGHFLISAILLTLAAAWAVVSQTRLDPSAFRTAIADRASTTDEANSPPASAPSAPFAPFAPADPTADRGTLDRGEAHFFDLACWRCHSLGDSPLPGAQDPLQLGPDLATVGDRLSPEAVRESIVDPGAVIAEPAEDHTDESGRSLMPPLADAMSSDQLEELVAFLSNQHRNGTPESIRREGIVIDVTETSFQREALEADGLVLLDFWAEWCLPCLELDPILKDLAADLAGSLTVCRIHVDENPALVADHVPDNMFPCLILLRNGEVLDRRYGTDPEMSPAVFLRKWIREHQ